ncbi:radical SAM protein [Cognatazoarcus halotolerans]|uniref:radical SAM protein n=1 Tax=Cognatazoarcus halotolerans TaxID=2686016 RepID=UPI0013596CCD|nr:radical SAM protein [Cognatazoarcus halotolerans]MCP5233478.1 radical SAM protein [Zoogloeaceae bacterium]
MIEKPFFVILTNRCNLACPHCYNELDPLKIVKSKEQDAMSRERLQFLFGQLKEQGYEKGFFSGGEALLRSDAPEVVGDAHALGLKTALFTNGHLFTPQIIARLARAGLDEVRISLNELAWIRNRDQYEHVFARQTEWVSALREAGIGVGIIFIISQRSMLYMAESHERVRQLGAGMKIQPLYLPHDVKGYQSAAAGRMAEGDWNGLLTELESLVARTDFTAESDFEVYSNPWKLLRYLRFVRDVYVMGARPDFCPTGPLLIVDSDGYFHPCLFRFDLVCGHIASDADVRAVRSRVDGHEELRRAPCFREECLSAYR